MNTTHTSDDEEEVLVYVEFDDSVNMDQYRSVHVLGINESKPIIQMDDTFFSGQFENALGTYMFFEEDLSAQSADPLLDRLPEKNLKFVLKTRKVLNVKQAYVTTKEEQEISNQSSEMDIGIEPVNFKKIEEALAKFKDEFKLAEEAEQKSSIVNSETGTKDN